MTARRDRDEGVTTVEFALVVPLFIALVGIGMYFAWIFFAQTQLDRAANRAARTAAVPTTAGTYGYCEDAILAQVNGSLFTGSITDPAEVIVSDGTGAVLNPASRTGVTGTCTVPIPGGGSSTVDAPSGFVKVRVTHDFTNPFSTVIGWFTGAGNGLSVSGTGQVRVEHQ